MADDLQYKVYLLEGQENFVTETKEYALKKEYQFPDSLIDFLYVDFQPLMGAFEQLGRDIENLYQKKDAQYTKSVLDFLHDMAEVHPYFEITYHVWKKRFRQAEEQEFKNIIDLLPRQTTDLDSFGSGGDTASNQRYFRQLFGQRFISGDCQRTADKSFQKISG